MKFFFLKEHGLYKIFKTLEKVPKKKTIHIHIDPEHAFFQNDWRAKQIKEILEKKQIVWLFIAKTHKAKIFFERNNLQYIFKEKHPIRKTLHMIKLFLFDIKKFHLHAIDKKNYIFFVVFGAEFLFVCIILFALYTLIVPSTTLQITPTYQIEDITYNFRYYPVNDEEFPIISRYLNIPFYSGYIDHRYELTMSASNIRHIQNPSKGTITITNTTEDELSLVPNTRFITEDWLFFRAPQAFTIPSGTADQPGEVTINIEAMEIDNEWVVMGTRGNIWSGTELWIRNLTRSFFTKEISAVTTTNFQWWSSVSTGFLTEEDEQILSERLVQYINNNTTNILTRNFNDNNAFFLNFEELVNYEILNIQIDDYSEQEQPILRGEIHARIYFPYVLWEDFNDAIMLYINQRPSEKINIIGIDKNSLIFYSDIRILENLYVIPTKISIIQGYDFQWDVNQIIDNIKDRIVWVNERQARDILLSYPEISTARIIIRPPRYTTIPKLKSRIRIRIDQPE